jgi:peptidoglycan/LPS O-acetylase OafA/YrhL
LSVNAPISVPAAACTIIVGPRIPALDGLRGIAILAVILFHIDQQLVRTPHEFTVRLYHAVASLGWSGVDLFFVLSGFLITGILYDSTNKAAYFQTFYVRRALRIFPLYYAFLGLVFIIAPPVLTALGHANTVSDHIRPGTQVFAWFYIANWFSGTVYVNYFSDYITHIWSLSVEEQFYLVWPSVVKRLDRVRLKRLCCVLAVISLLCRLALYPAGMHAMAYTWTICRMDGIAMGAYLALCLRIPSEWEPLQRWAPRAMPLSAAVFVILARLSLRSKIVDCVFGVVDNTVLVVLFSSCLVLALSPRANWIRAICSWRIFREWGKYSYGAYVWHQPLLIVLRRCGLDTGKISPLNGGGFAIVIVVAVSLVLIAATAFLSWHLFEKHFLRLKEPLSLMFLRKLPEIST